MVDFLTASTQEIDDPKLAVADILQGLGKDRFRKNSVALISFYPDFIDTGTLKAVCDALPCPSVGISTNYTAVSGMCGNFIMTVTVLTSDDVSFVIGQTDPLPGPDEQLVKKSYLAATEGRAEKPSLVLSYAPLLANIGNNFYSETMDALTGGTPNFGTLPIDYTTDYHLATPIFNGVAYKNRYFYVLVYGELDISFYIASIADKRAFDQRGVVTSSQGNIIHQINKEPVSNYFRSIGITTNDQGEFENLNAFPFIVYDKYGNNPVIRVIYAMTQEGGAVCGSAVSEGAKISVGTIDVEEVLSTTSAVLEQVIKDGKKNLLIYSCVGRYFALGYSPTMEAEKIKSVLNDAKIDYQLSYSGGELCPVRQKGSSLLLNKDHNDTMIICAF
jgi:hypothetical protein